MGKNVGLTYGEFQFPAEQGFTGSAGVNQVKGYSRGGHVKKTGTANAKHGGYMEGGLHPSASRRAVGTTRSAKGGKVMKYAEGGKFGKPGDKYPTLKSGPRGKQGSSMPKNVKNRGGEVSMHDKLKHEGGKMGYAYGGQVKNTSAQFKQTRGKQDTMDHGVQPAQTGRNQAEVEAGGNKRLKAGYKHGGTVGKKGVHRVRAVIGKSVTSKLKKLKGVMSEGDRAAMRRIASGKNMPKNVKAHGGLAKYAHGGAARKPYTGYNEQAGGSGNEDARYMQAKK